MERRYPALATMTAIWIGLLLPPCMAGQGNPRYKLIDVGTFGGPASYLTDPGAGAGELVLNDAGVLIGKASTAAPDPTCFEPDCFVVHAFRWNDGMLTDLGTLPGGSSSDVASLNARGWVAGESLVGGIDPVTGRPVQHLHAVLWKGHEITDLGTLGGTESVSASVNDGGEVVGFSTVDTNPDPSGWSFLGASIHPFIWKNGGMRDLGTLGGPDALPNANCNNQRSNLVTGFSFADSTPNPDTGIPTMHPVLWQNGMIIDLGTLGGTLLGELQCANNAGQVAGAMTLEGNSVLHAFLWEHGVMRDLGTLGGDNSTANWINNAGQIVGDADLPGSEVHHAFLWRDGVMIDLGTLGTNSHAEAINAHGQVVGRSRINDTTVHAFLWENGGPMVDLNTLIVGNSGLELFEASNINGRGEIPGRGLPAGCTDVDACGHVFLLVPCDAAGGEDCSPVVAAATQSNVALSSNRSATPAQQLLAPIQSLKAWRARLAQRYHLPGLTMRKD